MKYGVLLPALLTLLPRPAPAEPPIHPPLIERMKQATMATFRLDRATIHEGLSLVKSEWVRQHPRESFPIILIEPEIHGTPSLITLDLQNVPFWVAVQALGHAGGLAVHDDGKTIRIDAFDEGDVATKVFMVTPEITRKLGLSADGTFQKADAALARFGVAFDDASLATLSPDGTFLTVRQTPAQLQLLPGILHLLAHGFSVEAPPDSAKRQKMTGLARPRLERPTCTRWDETSWARRREGLPAAGSFPPIAVAIAV